MNRTLEFLRPDQPPKTVRTSLYGDQKFSLWEIELLHTPVLQRLYDLKQLGFADRVYPDAVHSRFNHVLGVAERAEQMAKCLVTWLRAHRDDSFAYAIDVGSAPVEKISGGALADHVSSRLGVVRLIGLLHDLTHAAFGHTLEDEVQVFDEKHDHPTRQARFFDALVGQLLLIWCTELGLRDPDPVAMESVRRLQVDIDIVGKQAEEIAAVLQQEECTVLAQRLTDLHLAFLSMLHIEYLHDHEAEPPKTPLVVTTVLAKLAPHLPVADHVIHRDAIFVDIVGNTICADLIDYAERDSANAGLRVQFDVRLMRYIAAVSVDGSLSPSGKSCIRLAIQFFTNKMRHDVLSEMSGILKARYLISERILYHPTKCAAGAMLGSSVQLLGLRALPPWLQALGDTEMLRLLNDTAINVSYYCDFLLKNPTHNDPNIDESCKMLWPVNERARGLVVSCIAGMVCQQELSVAELRIQIDEVIGRAVAARVVLWKLAARRFPKLAFRLRSELQQPGGFSAEDIATKFSNRDRRYELEREIERACALPLGSMFIHCPPRKTSMKVAQALVVGADLKRVAHLRDVTNVSSEGLGPYQAEIRAVEDMYKSIWQFHAYVDKDHVSKAALVARALERKTGFSNDELLVSEPDSNLPENPYDVLASELKDEVAVSQLPLVIARLDAIIPTRMRFGMVNQEARALAMRAIREVAEEVTIGPRQLELPSSKRGGGSDGAQ
jgi:HD superfamily phosphohydrolase